MPRPFFTGMLSGTILGALLSALVCLSLVRVFNQPAYVNLSGLVLADSASYPDSRMHNRIFLVETALEEPVYIRSKAIDGNNMYGLVNQYVQIRGEFQPLTLKTGESILEIEVKDVVSVSTSG